MDKEKVIEYLEDNGFDLNDDESTVADYIESLDYQVEVTVTVKKSNKYKLIAYADGLK